MPRPTRTRRDRGRRGDLFDCRLGPRRWGRGHSSTPRSFLFTPPPPKPRGQRQQPATGATTACNRDGPDVRVRKARRRQPADLVRCLRLLAPLVLALRVQRMLHDVQPRHRSHATSPVTRSLPSRHRPHS
eukprot:scaffold48046_cov57-Phaeocystis_antarctica.AAC.2